MNRVPHWLSRPESTIELNLSYRGLKTLRPERIENLTDLTALYLSGNKLTALPPEIGNLTNLIYLELGNNQLTALPPEIGNLSNLRALELYDGSRSLDSPGNPLTVLPPEIGNLTSLDTLDLNDNQLTELPPEIGNLTNLVDLTGANLRDADLSDVIGTDFAGAIFEDRQPLKDPEEGNHYY